MSKEPFQPASVSKSKTRTCRGHLVPSSLGAVFLALLADNGHPLCKVIKSDEGLPLLFVMLGQANTQKPQVWCLNDALLLPDACSIPAVTSVLSSCLWKDKVFLFNIPGLLHTGLSHPTETCAAVTLWYFFLFLFLRTSLLLSNCELGTEDSSYIHCY